MKFTDDFAAFRADSGQAIILGNGTSYPLLFSEDGTTFYELLNTGGIYRSSPDSIEAEITYDDPHTGTSGRMLRDDDRLEWNGIIFQQVEDQSIGRVIPVPKVRTTVYFCQMAEDEYIYLSADKNHPWYSSYRLYTGRGNAMREITIPQGAVDRRRDGGTTFIYTAEGAFYFPTPYDKTARPSWRHTPLTDLNPEMFNISESEDGVTITPK